MFLTVSSKQAGKFSVHPSQFTPSISEVTQNYKSQTSGLLKQSKEQLLNLKSIENGFHVAKLYSRFQLIDKALFMLLLINCVGIGVYLQLQMKMVRPVTHAHNMDVVSGTKEEQTINRWSILLIWMNFIITVFTVPVSFLRYRLQSSYQSVQKKPFYSIYQLYQSIIILIQPLPFLQHIHLQLPLQVYSQGYIQIKLNLILVILCLSKLSLIARYLFWHNLCTIVDIRSEKFFKPSYNRICKIYSCEKNYIHVIKCLFRQNFIIFIAGFYLTCMTGCAYCLRIVETHYDGRFSDMANCMWFTLLSMTTVGYGDIYVSSPIGIALDCFLMFSGVVISSLLVSSLNDFFSMGYRQKRSLTLLKRLKDKGELKQLAAMFIAKCVQRNYLQKKHRKRIKVSQQQRLYCRLFHESRMILRCGKQKQLNLYRDMSNQFQSVILQLDQLMEKFSDDIQTLSQKQRLSLNQDSKRNNSLRNRSSSYFNLIKLKSRDSRASLMQPIFNNNILEKLNEEISNVIVSCGDVDSEESSSSQEDEKENVGIEDV